MPNPSLGLVFRLSALAAVAPALAHAQTAASIGQYAVVRTVALGAPERWDYVVDDATAHRVYVSHGDRVTVVDDENGTILGEVTGLAGGTHGIAIASAAGRGYTDDGEAGVAASFDLKSFKVQQRLKADDDADAVIIDPVSGHVFVVDGDPGKLSVIDPKLDQVIASPMLGSKLEYAVAGSDGKLYVNSVEKHEIVRVDTASNQVDAHWPMSGCERPHGLAIDAHSHRLFSGCSNSALIVMDSQTGRQVTSMPIGKGSDAVAFDPVRKLVFSSNGADGTVSVIQEKSDGSFVALPSVSTVKSSRTMSVNVKTGRLYVVAADLDATQAAPAAAAAGTAAARTRPRFVAGSLKLLMLDPR